MTVIKKKTNTRDLRKFATVKELVEAIYKEQPSTTKKDHKRGWYSVYVLKQSSPSIEKIKVLELRLVFYLFIYIYASELINKPWQ